MGARAAALAAAAAGGVEDHRRFGLTAHACAASIGRRPRGRNCRRRHTPAESPGRASIPGLPRCPLSSVVPRQPAMARPKTSYVCGNCGARTAQWQGQCPACEAWNTLELAASSIATAARPGVMPPQRGWPVHEPDRDRHRAGKRRAGRDRHRRTRPGPRRRSRGRLGRAAGRRPRHRQVHAAAAGGRRAQSRTAGAVRIRAKNRCGRSPRARSGSASAATTLRLAAETRVESILDEAVAARARCS